MKIDKIQINGTTYDINGPATAQEYGLIKLGYTQNDKNYPVLLSEGKAYVNVPWDNTIYTLGELMGASAKGSETQPIYWNGSSFVSTTHSLNADVPNNAVFTDTKYNEATTTNAGLMSATDKSKLDGLQNYILTTATASALGGIKAKPHSTAVGLENISDTANRYYQIEVTSDGKAFVNVPWVASQSGNGAITEIQMNGSAVTNINGVVNLGTVITEDNVVVYEVIRDLQDPTKYRLTSNKTFNDIHTDYLSGNKQINIKYTYDQSCTRIYTLSYIDSGSAIFLYADVAGAGDITFYYITSSSAQGNEVSMSSRVLPPICSEKSSEGTLNMPIDLAPDNVNVWSTDVDALYVALQYSNKPCVYSLRFKTDNTFDGLFIYVYGSDGISYNTNVKILCPTSITWDYETEYEVSILFDGANSYSVKQIGLGDELQFGNNDYAVIS